MIAKFKNIAIENFKSFKGLQVFNLDRPPGLYYITGKNLVEPELGGNGIGKSSLIDAISVCNYGVTTRGAKGPSLRHWGTRTAYLQEEVDIDGSPYQIKRTLNPNTFLINGATSAPECIDNFLTKKAFFLSSVLIGQFNTSFIDLKPTDRLDMFSEIMDLALWEQCSDAASDRCRKQEIILAACKAQQDACKTTIANLKEHIKDLESKATTFETDRDYHLATLRIKIDEARENSKLFDSYEKIASEYKESVSSKVAELNKRKARLENQQTEVDGHIGALGLELAGSRALLKMIKESYTKWKGLEGSCPYCLQTIDKDSAGKHIVETTQHVTKETKNINELLEREKGLKSLKADIQLQIDGLKPEFDGHAYSLATASSVLSWVAVERGKAMLTIRTTQDTIDTTKSLTNPYHTLIASAEAALTTNDLALTNVNRSVDIANRDYSGNYYWVRGFKDLRLWLVSDALTALTIEANNNLAKLGLVDWNLKFQMERETSTGGLSRGFHILVASKDVKEGYVPVESWSGGETQRLKVATTKGMSSLIQNYTGFMTNIEMWDEPSSHLSEEGVDSMITFFSECAEESHKAIYLVDHRSIESSRFTAVINMHKTEEGSKFVSS